MGCEGETDLGNGLFASDSESVFSATQAIYTSAIGAIGAIGATSISSCAIRLPWPFVGVAASADLVSGTKSAVPLIFARLTPDWKNGRPRSTPVSRVATRMGPGGLIPRV